MEALQPLLLDLGLPGGIIAYLLWRDKWQTDKIDELQERRVSDATTMVKATETSTHAIRQNNEAMVQLAAEIRAGGRS